MVELATIIVWLVLLAIWDVVWKGLAMWEAAKRREKGWFIAILIINSVGILPIIYLLIKKNKGHINNRIYIKRKTRV